MPQTYPVRVTPVYDQITELMNPYTTHGSPSWYELLTSNDIDAAAFYAKLFGWNILPMEMAAAGGTYHVMQAGIVNAAGIMTRPEPTIPPCWVYYITVDDVDSLAAKLPGYGATDISPVYETPGIGRFCWFTDPQGARLAAITYENRKGDYLLKNRLDAFTTPGLFSWMELQTTDPGSATDFYRSVFGWNIEVQDMPVGPYYVLKVGDLGVGGAMKLPVPDIPPHWSAYVTVRDVDASLADAESGGGGVCLPAFDVPGVGRLGAFTDPQGAFLAVAAFDPVEM